ncbi:transposase [Geobacillus sp. LYN3]|uniref:transposase n=1 Tax=Geobacillus sp. LYN3 TaxID=2169582 RepID=UPI000D3953A7|nr:transposase [Geobacillus sp. LYN3]PUF89316.1 hypothetical protein DCC82_10020 [Geobacillus sp. LYN3]
MAKKMKAWIKTIRQLFSSEELTRLARKVGFIQRQRSLTAEAFLTLCAWGDGSLACQSLQRLCADLALWHDCSLSNEGMNQRFTPRAVAFLYVRKKEKKKGKALSRQTLEQKKYHILLTNLPQESFDAQQVYELYSLRWQVELLFKGWKSLFDLDRVKKMKKERFECHLYGTLIAILVTQTLLFQARRYWHQREGIEISEWKALNILQSYWHRFLLHPQAMETALPSLLSLLRKHARKDRRKGEETVSDLLKKLGIW